MKKHSFMRNRQKKRRGSSKARRKFPFRDANFLRAREMRKREREREREREKTRNMFPFLLTLKFYLLNFIFLLVRKFQAGQVTRL